MNSLKKKKRTARKYFIAAQRCSVELSVLMEVFLFVLCIVSRVATQHQERAFVMLPGNNMQSALTTIKNKRISHMQFYPLYKKRD